MPQLLLMVLAASSLDGAFRIEPVGWSADERKVALRVFFDDVYETDDCEGYLDASGKPFHSGLALVVLENGVVTKDLRIQDPPPGCTPLATARARLDEAKQVLEKLGIDRKKPGQVAQVDLERTEPTRTEREGPEEPLTTSKWKETFTAPGAATLTVENQTVCGVMSCTITATCAWTVSGAKRFSGKTKRSRPYDTMGAGNVSFVLEPVLVSPSKQVVLAFFQERFTSMRAADFSTRLLWPAK